MHKELNLLQQHFDTALESPEGIKKTAGTDSYSGYAGKTGGTGWERPARKRTAERDWSGEETADSREKPFDLAQGKD